jgi:TPR repeat protein
VRRFFFVLFVVGCGSGSLQERQQKCVECALRQHETIADMHAAVARFDRGCLSGDARSCSVLGVMYEEGRGVRRDAARARALYAHACSAGNAPACTNLGRLVQERDTAGALVAFEVACHRGDVEGCRLLRAHRPDDGRTIQSASASALRTGATVSK